MRYILIILFFLFISCSSKIERPEIMGHIYDKKTKEPIGNVEILSHNQSELFVEAKTDSKGVFKLKKKSSTKLFDFESGHDPKIYFIVIRHSAYISDTIEARTRGSFTDKVKVYDSIYLLKK